MKKGQLEAIGLVIIVILIIAALLIFLVLSSRPQADKYTTTLLQTKANNLRNSILKTTISQDCNIKEEIINCVELQTSKCSTDCSKVKDTILSVMPKALDEKDGYELTISSGSNNTFLTTRRYDYPNCITASTSNLKDDIDFNLKLCRE
jgi:hypothetical protein